MPIFKYRCSHCETEEERIVLYSKKDEQLCQKCNEKTDYQPSFNTGAVVGLPNGYAPVRSKSREKRNIGGADTK